MSKLPIAMYRIENAHDLLDALEASNGDADILCMPVQDKNGNHLDMFRVWEETLSDGSTAKTIELWSGTAQEFHETKTPYEIYLAQTRRREKKR